MALGSLSPTDIVAEILEVVVVECFRYCKWWRGCFRGVNWEEEEKRLDFFGERRERRFGNEGLRRSFERVKEAEAVVAAIVVELSVCVSVCVRKMRSS